MRLAALLSVFAALASGQTGDARQQLIEELNRAGLAQLKERAKQPAQGDADIRSKLRRLIGVLPKPGKIVQARTFGTVAGEGFRIEKIAFESLQGMWVTANVYVPVAGQGPFPAVLLWPGHGASGKIGLYNWGANLAANGMIAMAIDPIGQGERVQHFDPVTGASQVGGPTGEHGHAAYSTLIFGDHIAQYFLADGIRAIDYLYYRNDVDAARIGAFGCSGGGTATAYLAAMDARVRVAVVACYITSYEKLLPGVGPQEAEQTIPKFLTERLDFADWVTLAAPKAYAIVSTEGDYFPFEGARQTYEEAKRIWQGHGWEERLEWITGPGGHGALGPVSPRILGFLARWLKDEKTAPAFRQFPPVKTEDLWCTPTGQLSTSIGSETVESYNRKQVRVVLAATQHKPVSDGTIRSVAMIARDPERQLFSVMTRKSEPRDGYRVDTMEIAETPAILGIPDGEAKKPLVILLDSAAKETTAARPDFERLVKAGRMVLVLQPRGTPGPDTPVQSPLLGPFNLIALRAMAVGQTLVGMRVEDTLRALDWFLRRPDVERRAVTLYGNGPQGVVALHAAALDKRITGVVIENTLISYRWAVMQQTHRNLAEIAMPGVLRAYDLGDLLLGIAPAPVTVVNPVDAMGDPVSARDFRTEMAYVFAGALVRLVSRKAEDPLPIE
jgi:cephalosporin-C deacetylase-like acetyl esterase